MLDAFIIDRIREDQNRSRERAQIPLQIEVPPEERETWGRREPQPPQEERGIVEIDFSV